MLIQEQPTLKKKVLLVDDDVDFNALVGMMLSDSELHMTTVQDGIGAMPAIREQQPDLVILDLMLPDMNGWEIFMAMRAEAQSADIPVIILSCVGTRHDVSFGLQVAHVHDYLLKPCLPSRLRASVASALAGGAGGGNRPARAFGGRMLALQN
jgi:two-component system response regulator MtrA